MYPNISKVKFGIPMPSQGILSKKGLELSSSAGGGEIVGGYIDPATVGVERCWLTVDNGYGMSTELITIRSIDPYAPVLSPEVSLNSKTGLNINYVPEGSFLTTGSGERVRTVEWTAKNLPDGLSLDSGTGRITGKVETVGSYLFTLSVQTNCGSASSVVALYVSPMQAETLDNPFESGNGLVLSIESLLGTEEIAVWRVSPPGGEVLFTPAKCDVIEEIDYYDRRNNQWQFSETQKRLYGNSYFLADIDHIETDSSSTSVFFKFTSMTNGSRFSTITTRNIDWGTAVYRYGDLEISLPVSTFVSLPPRNTQEWSSRKAVFQYFVSVSPIGS